MCMCLSVLKLAHPALCLPALPDTLPPVKCSPACSVNFSLGSTSNKDASLLDDGSSKGIQACVRSNRRSLRFSKNSSFVAYHEKNVAIEVGRREIWPKFCCRGREFCRQHMQPSFYSPPQCLRIWTSKRKSYISPLCDLLSCTI